VLFQKISGVFLGNVLETDLLNNMFAALYKSEEATMERHKHGGPALPLPSRHNPDFDGISRASSNDVATGTVVALFCAKHLEGLTQIMMFLLIVADAILTFLISASFFCTLKPYQYEDQHSPIVVDAGGPTLGTDSDTLSFQPHLPQRMHYVCTYYNFALIQGLYPFALLATPFLGLVAVILSDTRLGRLYGECCFVSLLNTLLAFFMSVHDQAHVTLCLGLLAAKIGEVLLVDHWIAQIECRRGLRGWTRVYRYRNFKHQTNPASSLSRMPSSTYGAV
jgi:hypothetical protein